MLYVIRRFPLLFCLPLFAALSACTEATPEAKFWDFASTASVVINRAKTQAKYTNVYPITFELTFARPVNTTTFTAADIVQTGTATIVSWSFVPSISPGDNRNFILSASPGSNGWVIPIIDGSGILDTNGNAFNSSFSTDNVVLYSDGFLIFVSSGTYIGKLNGIAGADTICQNLAAAQFLPNSSNFMALLGNNASDPLRDSTSIMLPPSMGPIVNLNGGQVASDYSELFGTTTNILEFVQYDEAMAPVPFGEQVWTGMNTDGTASNNSNCNGWTDDSTAYIGRTGLANGNIPANLNQTISTGSNPTCDTPRRIYCISTVSI